MGWACLAQTLQGGGAFNANMRKQGLPWGLGASAGECVVLETRRSRGEPSPFPGFTPGSRVDRPGSAEYATRANDSTLPSLRSLTLKAEAGIPARRLWREWDETPDLEVSGAQPGITSTPTPLGKKGFPSSQNTQCFLSQGQPVTLCHLDREPGAEGGVWTPYTHTH